jgi:hypothetical protein
MKSPQGTATIKANGGKCPEGVKFIDYGNPHGKGAPADYDDTLAGVDGAISEQMGKINGSAHKSRNP